MGSIYKITNKINDKVYIGQTTTSLESRFYKHCWDAKNKENANSPLYKAMLKYGIENFSISLIENCENSLLDEREKYWIQYYNSFYGDGYNATSGGGGNAKVDEQEILILWEQGKNQKEIAKTLSCDRHTVSKHLVSNNISHLDRQRNKIGNAKKTVLQLNLAGEVVAEYVSATAAAEATNSQVSGISLVCNQKRKTHNGYIWKYKEN